MLTKEQNEALYKAGPGTPMGELLRRYWTPIGAVAELDDNPIKPIRLMNEDLVLYKDLSGHYGLVDRHCPHRRADLSYGWVEECGLRCNYHGWLWDESGNCAHQPFEEISHPDARFKDRVQDQGLLGRGQGRPVVGLHGATRQEAAASELRALPAPQRLRADRARRRALQLVPVPREHDRPGALRVAARHLVTHLARPDQRRETADAPEAQLRRVRARLPVPARARGTERRRRAVDRRPRLAVAAWVLSRKPLRVAHPGRRRKLPERVLVLSACPQGT